MIDSTNIDLYCPAVPELIFSSVGSIFIADINDKDLAALADKWKAKLLATAKIAREKDRKILDIYDAMGGC